jgi:hypothetical protein
MLEEGREKEGERDTDTGVQLYQTTDTVDEVSYFN